MTHLNDLTKAYLEQIAEKKKDDTYLEPDMKKRQANNEKARKELAKGPQMKNPHFEEKQKELELSGLFSAEEIEEILEKMEYERDMDHPKTTRETKAGDPNQITTREPVKRPSTIKDKKSPKKMYPGKYQDSGGVVLGRKVRVKEALDPVGKEDGDVNNDGKKDSSDSYLMKRRKAIAKAMKKESFFKSDWRNSISEVMTDIESKPIKEKKVNNKVKINPTMGEAVEEIGGTLIEEIEVDDIEGVIECVYGELIEEGYSEDEVESAIEQALTEATVTMGHDTEGPKAERTRDKLKKKAKGFLGKVAVKAYNKAREAKAAATPAMQRAKTSTKRGIRKMAQKVVDRMSEEVIGEAVYGGAKKPAPTDKRLTVTNADKAGNTPAYQKYKAGDKNYKAADHMKEGIRDVDPEKGTAERKARLEKKRGMKMDDHPQYKKEEVEVDEAMSSYDRNRKRAAQRAADRNAARAAGKTGAVPGVGYVSPRKERETYVDSAGTTRHKSGAKMEEVENVEELYKGKHGQTEKQYQDSRSDAGKMVSGDSKMSGSKYAQGRRTGSDAGPQPAGGSKKPQSQGKMDSGSRTDLAFRKAALKKKAAEMKEDASMSPQEVALQKKKAMLDKMIASKRMQGLKSKKEKEEPAKAMGEEASDAMKDRRMERGGVAGNVDYRKPPATPNLAGKKKPYDGMSALEKVKASIRAKHGQGAIMDTKKK